MELVGCTFKTWQIDSEYCQLMKKNDGSNFVVLKEDIDELIGLLKETKRTMVEIEKRDTNQKLNEVKR